MTYTTINFRIFSLPQKEALYLLVVSPHFLSTPPNPSLKQQQYLSCLYDVTHRGISYKRTYTILVPLCLGSFTDLKLEHFYIRHWSLYYIACLIEFLWQSSSRARRELPYDCQMEKEVQILHLVSVNTSGFQQLFRWQSVQVDSWSFFSWGW